MTATTDANLALVRRLLPDALSAPGGSLHDLFAAEVAVHLPSVLGAVHGCGGLRAYLDRVHAAFPDWSVSILDSFATGDRVGLRLQTEGTHDGEYLGFGPTGRRFRSEDVLLLRFSDGRVREAHVYPPVLGILEQLRVVPVGPPGGPLVLAARMKSRLRRPSPPTWTDSPPVSWSGTGDPAGADDPTERNSRFANAIWNARSRDACAAMYAPDFVFHSPQHPEPVRGRAEYLERHWEAVVRGFPDFHLQINLLFATDERFAGLWTVTGTHAGELGGMPPTWRWSATQLAVFACFEDGQASEMWVVGDLLGQLRQLGVVPAGPPSRLGALMIRAMNRTA